MSEKVDYEALIAEAKDYYRNASGGAYTLTRKLTEALEAHREALKDHMCGCDTCWKLLQRKPKP